MEQNLRNDGKIKILALCDHPMGCSGVGSQADLLFKGLLNTYPGKYCLRVFGGAIKHEDYRPRSVPPYDNDYIIVPTDGFGDRQKLRVALASEKPDILFLFTDPRFFIWVFEMEDEVHDVCPIIYNHLWDQDPWPEFNKVLYESTDQINCINKLTYEFVHEWFPDKSEYIPHALDPKTYYKISPLERLNWRKQLFGPSRADWFMLLFVSRNARRKMLGASLEAWKIFLEDLQKTEGHKNALFITHCDPHDREGANLLINLEMLGITENVFISNQMLPPDKMNALYNLADANILISCNEGFGLSVLNSAYCGVPTIGLRTGGIQDQIIDGPDVPDSEKTGILLEPDANILIGSQVVPYIRELFCDRKTVSKAIMKMYKMGPEKRSEMGKRAMQYAHKKFDVTSLVTKWDKTITDTIIRFRENKLPRYKMVRI